jgi:hypothetical protein
MVEIAAGVKKGYKHTQKITQKKLKKINLIEQVNKDIPIK